MVCKLNVNLYFIGRFRELALICDGRKDEGVKARFGEEKKKRRRDKETQDTQSKRGENKSALTLVSHETSKPTHIGHFFHPSIIRLPSKEDIFLKEERHLRPAFFTSCAVLLYVNHFSTLILLSIE